MAARSTMAPLITELRRRVDESGTADWSDDQLQDVLDRNRDDVRREGLRGESEYSGGSVVYFDYYWHCGPWVEHADGGTVWRLEDSAGSAIGTALYTPEYGAKHLRFAANTGGSAYFLTYRAFDLDRAAADVWDDKAASVASRFDIKTDNHDLKRSQLAAQYRAMAADYRRRAGPRVSTRLRDDMPVEPRYNGPFKPVNRDGW